MVRDNAWLKIKYS